MKFTRTDLDIPVTLECGCKILWHEGETLQRGVYAWCNMHGDTQVRQLSHGGKRKGAGRKRSAEPIVGLSATIYAKDLKSLKSLAPTVRQAIRLLLTRAN